MSQKVFFFNSFIFPTLNKKPALPPKIISLGTVGQFEDIIIFFKYCDSSKTFGNPYNFEDNIKIIGYKKNPYPYINKANIFILSLSLFLKI